MGQARIEVNFLDRMTAFTLSAYPNARVRLFTVASIGCLLSLFGVMRCGATISDLDERHIRVMMTFLDLTMTFSLSHIRVEISVSIWPA
jgi:hypothetical protein